MRPTPYLAVNTDGDSPEQRMLVVVYESPINGRVTIEYVSDFVRKPDPKWRKPFTTNFNSVTPIESFAVRAVLRHNDGGHWLDCEQIEGKESTAKYRDDVPRRWQGFNKLAGRISAKMLPILERCITVQDAKQSTERTCGRCAGSGETLTGPCHICNGDTGRFEDDYK